MLGGLAMVPTAAVAWAQGWLSVGGRLFYSLLALAAPLLAWGPVGLWAWWAWWAWYWNLLGWQW